MSARKPSQTPPTPERGPGGGGAGKDAPQSILDALKGIRRGEPLVFDIETAPLPDDALARLMPDFKGKKGTKDEAKIKEQVEEARQSFIEKAALSAQTGCMIAFGFRCKSAGVQVGWTAMRGDYAAEQNILGNVWKLWQATLPGRWIGHNVSKFDLPFLMRRSWLLGVPVPSGLLAGRYQSPRICDTMVAWDCGRYDSEGGSYALAALARAFGLAPKEGDSANLYKVMGSDMEGFRKALSNHITLTWEIAERMGMIRDERSDLPAGESEEVPG